MTEQQDGNGNTTTTIPLKKSTRDRLASWTGKGTSYDTAINTLLDRVSTPKTKEE